ncbi:unnamed protein product [Tilletia caries]|nr:unnamed protein product [Tilletia caries]
MADSDEKRQEVAVATRSSNDEDGGTMDEVQDVPKGVTRKAASKLRVFLWGHPPETKEERRLLVKIDFGMREELNFQGTQFNTVNTIFTVGYICGLIPNNLALQFVPARIWLPSMALIWSGLSMCLAAAKNPGHIMAIRFFQALAEASTFSGSHYLLGSWYKEDELGKRSGIFASSAQLGSLFSGVLQGAIFRSMEGYRGLRAFQWLFLLDGFIALPIALYGYVAQCSPPQGDDFELTLMIPGFDYRIEPMSSFLCFPDVPQTTRAWFLTEAERKLAVTRLPPRPHTKLEWNLVKRYYPLSLTAVAIVSTIICAHMSDFYHCRWPVNFVMAAGCILSAILILIWDIPFAAKFFAFSLAGIGYAGQGSNFAWANDVMRDDDQERAMVLASMNLWSNVVNSWWSIVLYPATDAPRFRKGMIALICVAVVTVIITLATRHLDVRERKRYRGDAVSRLSDNVEAPV